MARYNKIYAGPYSEAKPQVHEAPASEAILPGCIITLDGSEEFELHATAGKRGRVFVAQDNYLVQEGVDTAYAAADVVIGMLPLDEQFFYVRVPTGNDLKKGDPLVSNGSGKLVKGSTATHEALFFAEETYNNATGSDQLVLARVGTGTVA